MAQYVPPAQRQLTDLPVELLAEIYLTTLSPAFPLVCRHLYCVIKSFSPSVHAQYLLARHPRNPNVQTTVKQSHLSAPQLTRVLRYPICTLPVLKALCQISSQSLNRLPDKNPEAGPVRRLFDLPRRLFRNLDDTGGHGPESELLHFVRCLWNKHPSEGLLIPSPNPNSNNGYPLVRAVHARFTPLIEFLLEHGADPKQRDCMAVLVAIAKRDLALVKMLIEYPPESRSAKRRKRVDRVAVEPFMLNKAVRCGARDIVQYFVEEKGCVPDMMTLKMI